MTLNHDLDRLKEDLEKKRKRLEQQMSDCTLSSARTDDLAEKIRVLRDRMQLTSEKPFTR
jgi:hypothetical protein